MISFLEHQAEDVKMCDSVQHGSIRWLYGSESNGSALFLVQGEEDLGGVMDKEYFRRGGGSGKSLIDRFLYIRESPDTHLLCLLIRYPVNDEPQFCPFSYERDGKGGRGADDVGGCTFPDPLLDLFIRARQELLELIMFPDSFSERGDEDDDSSLPDGEISCVQGFACLPEVVVLPDFLSFRRVMMSQSRHEKVEKIICVYFS